MKVGVFTKPNEKGQIVIPKAMRDTLGINENVTLNLFISGTGLYIYPVKEIILEGESESSYLKLLEKTKGKWSSHNQGEKEHERSQLELDASKARKAAW